MAKIAIDAGHGLKTAGKRCDKSLDKNETREWVLNDRVADALASYLKSAGHTVKRVDDTDGSTDISVANRVNAANQWGADFYMSVHHNAGVDGGSGGGTVVFTSYNCSNLSLVAREAIYRNSIKRGNLKGNRYKGEWTEDFYVLKNTKMPAVLIECGFMDSSTDIKFILDKEWSKKIALGIAEGICEVFGGNVKTSAVGTDTAPAAPAASLAPFLVRVLVDRLVIRRGAGSEYATAGAIKDKGVYTIVATAKVKNGDTWGKLKSGAGWINLNAKYVKEFPKK